MQYADYTLWQRSLLGDGAEDGGVLAGQRDYWVAALAGLPQELALPADRPRPPEPSHKGGAVRFTLEPALHAGLLTVARDNGVTLFMVLQAALAALLTRLGAGTDIPLGIPVAGRGDEALHDLVGFFVNTLVLRIRTDGDPRFEELLARAREADLAAFEHQDVPFEWLVEVVNPVRSPARHPLFQVMLVSEDEVSTDDWGLTGLRAEAEPLGVDPAQFDLTVSFGQRRTSGKADGILLTVGYATDLFDRATMEAFAARLEHLLRHAAADPGQRLSGLDLLEGTSGSGSSGSRTA